jgi:hypothetical protein
MELLQYSQLLGHWKKLLEKEAHLANEPFEWHWHNWRFTFLPYLVQEFLEVSTSLHIRFLSRSPCITS